MTLDLSQYTQAEQAKLLRDAYMMLAPQLPFSAEGYKAHYSGIFSHSLPSFGWDWIQEWFEAYTNGWRRFLCKAHRGATKSTIWTVGFNTYVLAQFPSDGTLTVQKSDTAGGKTSSAVADIIENNIGWKTMYPHLVPDKSKRWAFEGYDIMDTRISYGEWRQQVMDERPKDNSFVGYGWSNGGIVGMHPRWLFVDDILDEENTRSKREMKAVADTMKGNVLQTLNRPPEWEHNYKEPVAIVSYTPWYQDDFYAYLESTGLYYLMETPLAREVDAGAKGAFEWRGKYWVCAWEVKDPAKLMDSKVQEWGEMDFQRMQMLDLSKAEGINLKREWLHEYPYEKINQTWPVYIGVDYASSADKQKDDNHDYFSISVGRVIPSGGVVLLDGFRDKISSGEAESMVKSFAKRYHPIEIGFDKTGKGEDAFNRLRAAGLPMIPCPPKGMGKVSKGERFEGQGGLGSAFQFSQAWISDLSTPFLKAFREEWAQWPNGKNDDALDSTYWMLFVAKAFLLVDRTDDDFLGVKVERKKSAFATLGKELSENR
jgi:phage terminase large subunit-like protein